MNRKGFFLYILSLVLVLVLFSGGNISIHSQTAFQSAINSNKYDNVTNDYSNVAEFAIDESSVAYVNTTGISKMPTVARCAPFTAHWECSGNGLHRGLTSYYMMMV